MSAYPSVQRIAGICAVGGAVIEPKRHAVIDTATIGHRYKSTHQTRNVGCITLNQWATVRIATAVISNVETASISFRINSNKPLVKWNTDTETKVTLIISITGSR